MFLAYDRPYMAHLEKAGSLLAAANEVVGGVFILKKPPTPELLEDGSFVTHTDFARAGEDAGKSQNYGRGVMTEIALKAVGLDSPKVWLVRGDPHYALYWKIYYMMRNPDEIKKGSQSRLLLGTQFVFDVLEASERRISNDGLPTVGKVGQRILNVLLFDDPKGPDNGERAERTDET